MSDCANICLTISAENATLSGIVIFVVLFGVPWLLGWWVLVCEITDFFFSKGATP